MVSHDFSAPSTVRQLAAQGVLIQRELLDHRGFESQASERGIAGLELTLFERWDRDGVLSPLAFARGSWTTCASAEAMRPTQRAGRGPR
jgi:hypothetical protein